MTSDLASLTSQNRRKLLDVWPVLRDEVLADFAAKGMPQAAVEWYARNLEYNTLGGKLLRGLAVLDSLTILKGRSLTDAESFKASVLGWCVELLQAFELVADDIMDQSLTRRGHPCWYKVEDVGLIAVNDACIIEGTIFMLLKKHFRTEVVYVDLVELFHEMINRTGMGQLIDHITENQTDLTKLSLERYRLIAVNKSAYYSIYLPIALAMHMHGINIADKAYEVTQEISFALGEYAQIQDDFFDYAGSQEHTGNIGTDIINKCSWCIITASALASPEQRKELEQTYCQNDNESQRRMRQVFEQVGLREQYEAYEEEAHRRIMDMTRQVPHGESASTPMLNGALFLEFLDKLYKRSK